MSAPSEIPPVPTPPIHAWRAALETRELHELALAVHYAERHAHGTPGHLSYVLIAKLSSLLDRYADQKAVVKEPES